MLATGESGNGEPARQFPGRVTASPPYYYGRLNTFTRDAFGATLMLTWYANDFVKLLMLCAKTCYTFTTFAQTMHSQKSSSSGHAGCQSSRLQPGHTRPRAIFNSVTFSFVPIYRKLDTGHDRAVALNNFNVAGSAALFHPLWLQRRQQLHTRCACARRGGKSSELHHDAFDPLGGEADHPVGRDEGLTDPAASGLIATEGAAIPAPASAAPGTAPVDAVAFRNPAISEPAFLGRRRAFHLAAMLFMTLMPLPLPVVTEPPSTRNRTATGLILAPSQGGAPSAAAAMAPPTSTEPQQPQSWGPFDPGEVFCYVSPEPLGGAESAFLGPSPLHFRTLAAAVAACPSGAVVLVAAGRYRERLQLSRPVTLRAWPKVEKAWGWKLELDGGERL
ncbi:hypothetical protein Vretimale_2625 [Volvox reticuliferus]|uniref:Pectinesterase n=1 Tax=Volvox reticuliferus TaxID=1737510 RepID=A0A8J4D839_9CHLO|nr:hypothetical protein Vretimale_2625 [Volvox reticuliferus]